MFCSYSHQIQVRPRSCWSYLWLHPFTVVVVNSHAILSRDPCCVLTFEMTFCCLYSLLQGRTGETGWRGAGARDTCSQPSFLHFSDKTKSRLACHRYSQKTYKPIWFFCHDSREKFDFKFHVYPDCKAKKKSFVWFLENFVVFKEVFSENSGLMYGQYL